jgi:hypothetical protein
MPRYDSNFREPPWVIGSPKEVMDWVDASHPSKKKKDEERSKEKYLTNLHIRFDFDVDRRKVEPNTLFLKMLGGKLIEEDFDLLPVAELILRGLAKAKFRNTAKIVVDGDVLYEHPEKKSDLRKTIQGIEEFSNVIKKGKQVEITAILADLEKATAVINIKKIHKQKQHSVDILIKGRIKEEIYHVFLNYLNEKIGIKKDAEE